MKTALLFSFVLLLALFSAFQQPNVLFCTGSGIFTSCSIDCTGTGLEANCSDGVFSGSCSCGQAATWQGKLVVSISKKQLTQIDDFSKQFAQSESKNIQLIVTNLNLVKNTYQSNNPFEIRKLIQNIESTYEQCNTNEKNQLKAWMSKLD